MRRCPLGGDRRIGTPIAAGKAGTLIFFVDPLAPMPHEVDAKVLMRQAVVRDNAMALYRAAAEMLLRDQENG
ncbi:hypothetical protein [Mesorhizobium sp. CN2-181]|uniref:hypothetical protein n=1 Tax=Mesorhizobium yinganensis TaxID=3157707 RepID=UPI0032B8816E